MGLFELFRGKREAWDDLDAIEPLVRGTAYQKGAAAPRPMALSMGEVLDPRLAVLAHTVRVDGRTAAQFHEMADPVAVDNFLKMLRREHTHRGR